MNNNEGIKSQVSKPSDYTARLILAASDSSTNLDGEEAFQEEEKMGSKKRTMKTRMRNGSQNQLPKDGPSSGRGSI